MVTRKRSDGITPVVAPAASEPPTPASTQDPPLVPEPQPEALADQAATPSPHPVRRYRIDSPPPLRAGGYVLTERGWALDTGQPETGQEV